MTTTFFVLMPCPIIPGARTQIRQVGAFQKKSYPLYPEALFIAKLDEAGPLACIIAEIPCVVFVFSETHRDMMISQLVKQVWSLFLTEGSSFYQSSLVDIVGKASQESTPDAGVKVPRKRGVPKAKGKGAAKKKSRRQELLEQLQNEEGAEEDGDGQGEGESADSGVGEK